MLFMPKNEFINSVDDIYTINKLIFRYKEHLHMYCISLKLCNQLFYLSTVQTKPLDDFVKELTNFHIKT